MIHAGYNMMSGRDTIAATKSGSEAEDFVAAAMDTAEGCCHWSYFL